MDLALPLAVDRYRRAAIEQKGFVEMKMRVYQTWNQQLSVCLDRANGGFTQPCINLGNATLNNSYVPESRLLRKSYLSNFQVHADQRLKEMKCLFYQEF